MCMTWFGQVSHCLALDKTSLTLCCLYNVLMQATMTEGTAAANGIVNMIHPLDLSIKVQCLCSEMSEKYVSAPQKG